MRDHMNKDEYVKAAVAQIENETDKSKTALELAAHIDDRMQYYKEIGFEDSVAVQKAVEHMGDPDLVAAAFSELHPQGRVWTAVLAVLPIFIFLSLFWIYVIWSIDDGTMGIGVMEVLLLFCFIGLSHFGKKRLNRFLCGASIALFCLTYMNYAMIAVGTEAPVCSPIVLIFSCIVTGDFTCLSTFWKVGGITVAPWLTYASIAFYMFILLVLISAFVSVCKLREPRYSLFDKKISKVISVIQKSILLFSVLIVFISSYCPQSESSAEPLNCEHDYFNTVILIQSNVPCSVDEVCQDDIMILRAHWDWGSYIRSWGSSDTDMESAFDIDTEFITVECGNKLQYKFQKDTVKPEITKPYLYIDFIDSGIESVYKENISEFVALEEEDWQKTESVDTVCAAVDQYNCVEVIVNES